MKRIIVSVSNDLSTDQRVKKVCNYLHKTGWKVTLIGRKLPESLRLKDRPYKYKRFKLMFNQGFWFYAELNLRFFFYLLFKRTDALLANDLDTLMPNYLVSRIRRKQLYYDSHELFTEVPELISRPKIKNTWLMIEENIFPNLKNVYTVNQSIADIYSQKYKVEINVVRNIPLANNQIKVAGREELNLPLEKKILIVQGAGINIDRGIEEMLEAMQFLNENYLLLIIGGGDVINILKENSIHLNLSDKVKFYDKMSYQNMMQYTQCADLGITLDKDTNLNYKYSLPNKLFDYIRAGTPILSSDLIEIKKIINHYDIGIITPNHNPKEIADLIHTFLSNEELYNKTKNNLNKAQVELSWENECAVLDKIYQSA